MIAVQVAGFGGTEVLHVVDSPAPVPRPGEVLIRVQACGLNWSDFLQRAGAYPGGPKPPFIAGQEAAGIVVAHGEGVTAPPIGAAVSAIATSGLCAELAAVPAASCIAWPAALAIDQRAALPIAMLTGYHALASCAHAQPGELAVIHAAAGGVGSIAVQIARLLGLGVIATCSTDKRAHVTADRVCSYGELRRTAPDGVDIVLDGVGGDAFRISCGVIRPFGRIVVIGASSGEPQRVDSIKLIHRSFSVIGAHLRHLVARRDLLDRAIAACVPWALDGRVRARTTVLPVTEIRSAYDRLAGREVIGKLVVSFSGA
jgi:NADPH2:quinone reductase